MINRDKNLVGLFFYIDRKLYFEGCGLDEAEDYGDFKVYDKSHMKVWDKLQKQKKAPPHLDFDYYPRGRVVFRTTDETFIIYYDRCVEDRINEVAEKYEGCKISLELDEHYCCSKCNEFYVL